MVKKIAFALAILLMGSTAHAASLDFTTKISGYDLGSSVIAKLTGSQVGNDVQLSLTLGDSIAGQPNIRISQLWYMYDDPVSEITDLSHVSGSQFDSEMRYPAGKNNSGYSWDGVIKWANSDSLDGGDTSVFKLLGADIHDLFGGFPSFLIRLEGIAGPSCSSNDPYCDTAKYSGRAVPSAVPIPASLPLMAIGLGLVGFIARRRIVT